MSETFIEIFSNLILSPIFGNTPNSEINKPPKVSASIVSGSSSSSKKLTNSSISIFASTLYLLVETSIISCSSMSCSSSISPTNSSRISSIVISPHISPYSSITTAK